MKFAFVAKHRSVWPPLVVAVQRLPGKGWAWLCKALDVSKSGFHDWLNRKPAKRTLENEAVLDLVRRSFLESDRTPAFAGAGSMAHGGCGRMCWLKACPTACTALSG